MEIGIGTVSAVLPTATRGTVTDLGGDSYEVSNSAESSDSITVGEVVVLPGQTATFPDDLDPVADTDSDGCANAAEGGSDETAGGERNPLSLWDFYDVWTHPVGDPEGWERNASIDLFGDIFGVANRFGAAGSQYDDVLVPPTDDTGYHPAFDRGALVGPNPWDLGAADGSIDLFIDIFGVANQFGHDCS